MSTFTDAKNGAEQGAKVGSVVPAIGTVMGGAIGGTLGALGLSKGPSYQGRIGDSTGYNQTSYQNYSNMNDLVKQWNADNPNQYSQGATNSWTDIYGGGKSLFGKKKSPIYSVGYGIKNDTGNQAVDQYANYLLGGGSQGASDWLQGQRNNYSNAMQDAAKSAVSGYIDPYRQSQQESVANSLSSAFDEAKSKLDAQKAYGYLSDVGYQKALDKLMNQRGAVQAGMNDAYNAQVGNWENNLNDMYNRALSGIGAWDWVNPFDAENGEYSKQNALAKNYAQNSINQDILNSLLSDANTFTPEEWIAYGAGNQGQYNPFVDFTPSSSRKKRTTSTEGINEV